MKNKTYYDVIKLIAKIVYPRRDVKYKEEIIEPAIFISNHSGILGPVAAELYIDLPKRIWTIADLLNKETASNYIFHDFYNGRSKRSKKLWRIISRLTMLILRPIFDGNENYIFVNRSNMRIKETFNESITALIEGKSVVIFPECHRKYNEFINEFSDGFVSLARLYYSKTGKDLKFYPTYMPKNIRVICVGQPVIYDSNNNKNEEKKRIVEELKEKITALAVELGPHETIPYVQNEFYQFYPEFIEDDLAYWKFLSHNESE